MQPSFIEHLCLPVCIVGGEVDWRAEGLQKLSLCQCRKAILACNNNILFIRSKNLMWAWWEGNIVIFLLYFFIQTALLLAAICHIFSGLVFMPVFNINNICSLKNLPKSQTHFEMEELFMLPFTMQLVSRLTWHQSFVWCVAWLWRTCVTPAWGTLAWWFDMFTENVFYSEVKIDCFLNVCLCALWSSYKHIFYLVIG